MSDKKIYSETAKGKLKAYFVFVVLSLICLLILKVLGLPHEVTWGFAGFCLVIYVWSVLWNWGRVYWVRTDKDSLEVYDSVTHTHTTYSVDGMSRIGWYWGGGISVHLKGKNFFSRQSVSINTAWLQNCRELKQWVKALQCKIEQRDRTVRLRIKEKKLRDRFSIHGDLTVQDSIFVGLPYDAFKKIQRYIKCAAGLGMGFLMSFICPLGFIIVMAIGIYMNIRSSSFAEKHRLLFENPLIVFGRTKQELKIMALSDERIAGVLQFHCARKIFIIGSFLPLIAMAALFLTLMIVHS